MELVFMLRLYKEEQMVKKILHQLQNLVARGLSKCNFAMYICFFTAK